MNRIKKILEYLNESPGDNFLRHALALEYIKIGKDADARALFESILYAAPGYIASYYHLGKLFEKDGNTEKAIEWYEKGMKEAKSANEQHAYVELQAAYENLAY